MMWRNYRPNRYGRRNLRWPNMIMRNDLRGLNWDFVLGGTSGPVESTFPPMNVYEGEEGAIVTAEIPGVSLEDITITVKDNLLTLSGERDSLELPDGAQFKRRERGSGEFERTIKFEFTIDADQVNATFTDGILQIELPHLPEEKPKKIEIKSG